MTIISEIFKYIRGKRPIVGVPVIIINSKKEILLGKRGKNAPLYPMAWGLPGGMMEYGETPEQTAKREIKEELGVEIETIKQLNVKNNLPNKEHKMHFISIPFIAKIVKGIPRPVSETLEVKWFKVLEIKKMKLAYDHKEIIELADITS